MKPHIKGLGWLIAAAFFSYLILKGLPYVGKWIPWSFEKRISKTLGRPVDQPVCSLEKNAAAKKQWDKMILRVFPAYTGEEKNLPIHIQVIEGSTVNAFTWLAGDIYIYEGLIKQAESAEELAAVLAHEIEHAKLRHIFQRALIQLITYQGFQLIFGSTGSSSSSISAMLINLKFSREQEREADKGALQRLQHAHIDIKGFQNFFERMQKQSSIPGIFSDHPTDEDRVQFSKGFKQEKPIPIMTQVEWKSLQNICES